MAAITAAFVGLVFLPQMRSVRATSAELESKEQFVRETAGLPAREQALTRELAETQAFLDGRRAAIGSTAGEPPIAAWSLAAEKVGVTLTRLEPQQPQELATLRRVEVALGCRGSALAVFRWLQEVERSGAAVWLRELRLERQPAPSMEVEVSATLVTFAGPVEVSD
jgi:hypothetical protein